LLQSALAPNRVGARSAAVRLAAVVAFAVLAASAWAAGPPPKGATDATCPALLRHTFAKLQTGEPQSFCQYAGKVLLIVNTASYCSYTGQYEGLEALYRKYQGRGLVVLGFPSNDYGAQEPGSNKEIAEFCRTTYGVEFPMFEKVAGTRVAANPLYVELVAKTGKAPQWNFHKYLVDRSGTRIESFGSATDPAQPGFVAALERLLAEKPPS
jgi:glutathione peroxidase